MEYSVTSVVTSKKVNGLCGYDYGESPVEVSHNILTNHVAAPTVTHVCNHKTHDLRFVFCSGTKHKSESLFLCFKYELQVRLVCNQHLLP